MKQITSNLIRRLLLLTITVMCMGTYSFAQTEQVFFYDLTYPYKTTGESQFKLAVGDMPLVVNESSSWNFKNDYFMKISSVSNNIFTLYFNGTVSETTNQYFAINHKTGNGKYKLRARICNCYDANPDEVKFFYATENPKTSQKTTVSEAIIPTVGNNTEIANLYESNEFEITNADVEKDFYFGIAMTKAGSSYPTELQFADFELVRITESAENNFKIEVKAENCTVNLTDDTDAPIADLNAVAEGTTVKVNVVPNKNHKFGSLTYKLGEGSETTLENGGSFVLTDNATISAVCNKTVTDSASYDEFCKPTVTKDGNNLNKRWQVKGEILNANGLTEESPLSFEPTGDNQEQNWANTNNEILAYPGASFNLKVTFGTKKDNNDCGWGSLFVFQLRSDKGSDFSAEDKIFGKYNGDWENSFSTPTGLFSEIAEDIENGASASKENLNATFPIQIPEDINAGEIVVIRFIVCKTSEGKTYDENPCTTSASQLNYCDYIVRIAEEQGDRLKVSWAEPENGRIEVKKDDNTILTSPAYVEYDTEIIITPTANDGYEIESVTANNENIQFSENIYKTTIQKNTVIAATFKPKTYKLNTTVNSEDKGEISVKKGSQEAGQTVNYGDIITFEATPKNGFMFDKWTKKGTGEVISYRHTFDLTITEDTELVANFIEEGYPLMTRYFITDLSQQNRYFGEVKYSASEEEIKQLFKCETEEELPFTPYVKLHEQQREGAVIDKTETKIELVEGTTEFNMIFKQYTNDITYDNVVCEPELEWTQQAIYIDWNNDMKFEGTEIYDRISGSKLAEADGMTRKIEVPSGTKPGTYRMRVVQMQFDDNNNISHTNLFTENFGEIRLGMAYDFEIIVTPVTNTYPVTVATGITGGKLTLKVDGKDVTGNVEEGKTVTVEVTPDKYYELATLTYKVGKDGKEQDIMEDKSFEVTGETVVNATFSKLSYTITFQQPQNGTIKVMNGKTEIKSGDKVEGGTKLTVTDTPDENYVLSELKAGETDILKDKSFTVEDNTEIKATFELAEYTFNYTINGGEWVADITIKDGEGNVINDGDKVKYGSTYIVRAEKRSKYDAVNIKVNGEQVIAKVNGLVYTYTEKIKGDTHVTIDLYSDIESLDAESIYYDATAQVLYTGGAKTVTVYDLSGRLVLETENQENINCAGFEEGIYTAIIDNNVIIKFCK